MLNVEETFNLIVTCPRNREFFAIREFESLLSDIGDDAPKIWKSGISGVLLAYTNLNFYEVPYLLRDLLKENPWSFRDVKRVIPIEFNVKTSLDEFSKVASKLASRIGENESYKIEVTRRYTNIDRMDIIESIASKINRKVDLKNPDKIILVEILGPKSGLSLINPDGVLSVERELMKP